MIANYCKTFLTRRQLFLQEMIFQVSQTERDLYKIHRERKRERLIEREICQYVDGERAKQPFTNCCIRLFEKILNREF